MEYHISCRCGKQLTVNTEQAGTTIRCDCGETVQVPSLSLLRQTAGQGAYESGAIDTIHRMLRDGALPWGEACAVSGRPTQDLIQLVVQCERLYFVGDQFRSRLLVLALLGPWALLASVAGKRPNETHGRDTVVKVPLRVHRDFHGGLNRRVSQRKLRRLLRTVPVYARLLEEYPPGNDPRGRGVRRGQNLRDVGPRMTSLADRVPLPIASRAVNPPDTTARSPR